MVLLTVVDDILISLYASIAVNAQKPKKLVQCSLALIQLMATIFEIDLATISLNTG